MTLSSSLVVQPGQTSARGLWVSAGALSPDLGLESSSWGGLAWLEKRGLCKVEGGPVSQHLSPGPRSTFSCQPLHNHLCTKGSLPVLVR